MSPTTVIKQDGNNVSITTSTPRSTEEQKFTVGEEYDFNNPWVKEVQRMHPVWEGDKLVVKPVEKPDELPTVTRELDGEMLVMTMQKGGVATKRFYKKIGN